MDLHKTIRQLHVELAMINEAILCFERLEASSSMEDSESSTVEKKDHPDMAATAGATD